jgi:hypothetical protein
VDKTCSRCKKDLPATTEHFHRNAKSADGLNYYCKTCVSGYYGHKPNRKAREGYKICARCEQELPATDEHFGRNKRCSDGLHYWCKSCRTAYRISDERAKDKVRARATRQKQRWDAILHYSSSDPKCSCCGERTPEFLAIDHINGGGTQHRKEVPANKFYRWLRDNNWPEGYRVLCHNCNSSYGYYGYCPHQQETT